MDRPDPETGETSGLDHRRRMVLAGLGATCLVRPVLAQTNGPALETRPALASAAEPLEEFQALSRFLTGRESFDPGHLTRVHEGLSDFDPDLAAHVGRLLDWISARGVGAEGLQQALDAEDSDLAPLPRQIVRAWYTGVVGQGRAAYCIAFETSLMFQAVADRLASPSHCYGPEGSWSAPPA